MEGWIKTIFDTMCLGTSAAGLLPADKPTYDFKLDHWGVRPREVGEAWSAYSKRVMQADVWRQRVLPRLRAASVKVLASVQHKLVHRLRSLEWFGFDYMLDEALEVWLLEVNTR